jgi:hypothetical protein
VKIGASAFGPGNMGAGNFSAAADRPAVRRVLLALVQREPLLVAHVLESGPKTPTG